MTTGPAGSHDPVPAASGSTPSESGAADPSPTRDLVPFRDALRVWFLISRASLINWVVSALRELSFQPRKRL